MKPSKNHIAAATTGMIALAAAMPGHGSQLDPAQAPATTPAWFLLDAESGYERRQLITGPFAENLHFTVTEAGDYFLSLTDLQTAGALRKLGAVVADRDDSLHFAHLAGDGGIAFDLRPGDYSLILYAKPFAQTVTGEFAVKLQHLHGEPAAVPVPGALWLFGSGVVALAGIAQRRRRD